MPWIMQMAGCAVTILLVAFALWVGFWLVLVLATVSILIMSWRSIRRYLVAKGILNPFPGVPGSVIIEEEATRTTTIIDGDYTRVDEEKRDS